MIPPQGVTYHTDDTVTFFRICVVCGTVHNFKVTKDEYERWMNRGEFVQNVFPTITPEVREMLLNGTCPECFDKLFPPDPDECNGMCMTGADVGVPEYGHLIAYAHPDCPIHGDKSEDS
jgi:hypothetical protein